MPCARMENEPGIKSVHRRTIHRWRDGLAQRAVFRVAHHADDVVVAPGNAARAGVTEALADGVSAREEAPRESLVNDHLTRRRLVAVEPVEIAAGEHAHSHGLEITRRDL